MCPRNVAGACLASGCRPRDGAPIPACCCGVPVFAWPSSPFDWRAARWLVATLFALACGLYLLLSTLFLLLPPPAPFAVLLAVVPGVACSCGICRSPPRAW